MKTITANFAARTIKIAGKPKQIASYTSNFTCDDSGRWSNEFGNVLQADVIDACKNATNWKEIRAEHFPMHGFHN